DLANRAIRLFEARDCEGTSLAYWTDAKPVETQVQGTNEILVTVAVNGRLMLGVLDSGASVSALTMAESVRLGVNAKTPGVVTAGCTSHMPAGRSFRLAATEPATTCASRAGTGNSSTLGATKKPSGDTQSANSLCSACCSPFRDVLRMCNRNATAATGCGRRL